MSGTTREDLRGVVVREVREIMDGLAQRMMQNVARREMRRVFGDLPHTESGDAAELSEWLAEQINRSAERIERAAREGGA